MKRDDIKNKIAEIAGNIKAMEEQREKIGQQIVFMMGKRNAYEELLKETKSTDDV